MTIAYAPPVNAETAAPFASILEKLLSSVMQSQLGVLEWKLRGHAIKDFDHESVNENFVWLQEAYALGENRHLFDGLSGSYSPLRSRGKSADKDISQDDQIELPIDDEPEASETVDTGKDQAQKEVTRISRIVFGSVEIEKPQKNAFDGPRVIISSPLSVVRDFLSSPTSPAVSAYAAFAIRGFIFHACKMFPVHRAEDWTGDNSFNTLDLERALQEVETYSRTRFNSRGRDAFPARGNEKASSVLRHFLSSCGLTKLRFNGGAQAQFYLNSASPCDIGSNYEFIKPIEIAKLPEIGELINRIWGIQLPLRGADVVLRGGLRVSEKGGLVIAAQGGPGTGKTSFALAVGNLLAPYGVRTLFVTGEEDSSDLLGKIQGLLSSEMRRLSFMVKNPDDWLDVEHLNDRYDVSVNNSQNLTDWLDAVEDYLSDGESELNEIRSSAEIGHLSLIPFRHVIVFDGIHDWITAAASSPQTGSEPLDERSRLSLRLREFVTNCRRLRALVVITASDNWLAEQSLDYLVDVSIRLDLEKQKSNDRRKPDRNFTLLKARLQTAAIGTHGFQIAGEKGLRLSPQIDHQLDRKSLYKTQICDATTVKDFLSRQYSQSGYLARSGRETAVELPPIMDRANVFVMGEGSSGKATFALKIAMSPKRGAVDQSSSRQALDGDFKGKTPYSHAGQTLLISFLYPPEYYQAIEVGLRGQVKREYRDFQFTRDRSAPGRVKVIHLYPGNYKPDQLFNRIDWELDAASMSGDPFDNVVLDGLHNVFLQYPEIEQYELFWSQLYFSLRVRPITIISTHTTFKLPEDGGGRTMDDRRSKPLRDTLVQKTDYSFAISPLNKLKEAAAEFEGEEELKLDNLVDMKNPRASDWFCCRLISAPYGSKFPPIIWDKRVCQLIIPGSESNPHQSNLFRQK